MNEEEIKDAYHTMDELYEHRNLLWVALLNLLTAEAQRVVSFKTRKDQNGDGEYGWFIAGCYIPDIGQVSYHLPEKYWGMLNVLEIERNAEYDGHSSADVLTRLEALAKSLLGMGEA